MEQGKHEVEQVREAGGALPRGAWNPAWHRVLLLPGGSWGTPFGEAAHLAPAGQESAAGIGLPHLFYFVFRLFYQRGGSPPWSKENARWNK